MKDMENVFIDFHHYSHPKVKSLDELKTIIDEAYDVMISMHSIDMLPELREQFNKNKLSLLELKKSIGGTDYSWGYEMGKKILKILKQFLK